MAGATIEVRRRRSSSLKLAGLMVVFLAFAVAVLLDEGVLAGEIEGHDLRDIYACALRLWTAAANH